jgi:hypothetical protein
MYIKDLTPLISSFAELYSYIHLPVCLSVFSAQRSKITFRPFSGLTTNARLTYYLCRQESIISTREVTYIATKSGISIPSSELEDWSALLSGLNHCAKEILTLPDYTPMVDLSLYPRTNIHRPVGPIDTDHGGWAWKCDVKSTKPKSHELEGRTIAIKDNIAVAGVKCTNGTGGKVGEWVPKIDATLVTRILDAGGVIKGKAACENNCFGAVRYNKDFRIPLSFLNIC